MNALNLPVDLRPAQLAEAISGNFGVVHRNGVYAVHAAVDITVPEGTPVYPIYDGIVTKIGYNDPEGGNYIRVMNAHNQQMYSFSHLSSISPLQIGDHVSKTTIIGRVGHSGNALAAHIHCERVT